MQSSFVLEPRKSNFYELFYDDDDDKYLTLFVSNGFNMNSVMHLVQIKMPCLKLLSEQRIFTGKNYM